MGLSTTLATVFIALILITGLSINIIIVVSTAEFLRGSLKDGAIMDRQIFDERIDIDDISINKSLGRIVINVTNIGETSIMANNFRLIDLIVIYHDNSGNLKTLWIPYSQEGENTPYWKVRRVLSQGREGDLINRLSFGSSESRGAWDPHETLEVEVVVGEPLSQFVYVLMYSPSGVRSSIATLV